MMLVAGVGNHISVLEFGPILHALHNNATAKILCLSTGYYQTTAVSTIGLSLKTTTSPSVSLRSTLRFWFLVFVRGWRWQIPVTSIFYAHEIVGISTIYCAVERI